MITCPACKITLAGGKFCPECGAALKPETKPLLPTPMRFEREAELPPAVARQANSDLRILWFIVPVIVLIVVVGTMSVLTGRGNNEDTIVGSTVALVGLVSGGTIAWLWWRRSGQSPRTPGRIVGHVLLATILGIVGGAVVVFVLGLLACAAVVIFLLVVCSTGRF
ncbi:MAG: hypothetical protein K1X57_18975 [Gemmataceae bacterium]|nr:hypothetical protein [Gemmataceae bacterium]